MAAFVSIVRAFSPSVDTRYGAYAHPPNRSTRINTDFVLYGIIASLDQGRPKFSVLGDHVHNQFLDDNCRAGVMSLFCKAQACYRGLCLFARKWKTQHARDSGITTDLFMNDLSSLRNCRVLDIYDDESRTVYKFRLTDLIAIITRALTNCPDLFVEPLHAKNPYTGVVFSVAQLETIYQSVSSTSIEPPVVFRQYRVCGYDLRVFGERHEADLRDASIIDIARNGSDAQKYYHICKMMRDHRTEMSLGPIEIRAPSSVMLEVFTPYLQDYLFSTSSLNPGNRHSSKLRISRRLKRFARLNPDFGSLQSLSAGVQRDGVPTQYTVNTNTPPNSPRLRHRRARTRGLVANAESWMANLEELRVENNPVRETGSGASSTAVSPASRRGRGSEILQRIMARYVYEGNESPEVDPDPTVGASIDAEAPVINVAIAQDSDGETDIIGHIVEAVTNEVMTEVVASEQADEAINEIVDDHDDGDETVGSDQEQDGTGPSGWEVDLRPTDANEMTSPI